MKKFMDLIKRSFNWTEDNEKLSKARLHQNPYIAARAEWQHQFGHLAKQKHQWMLMAFGLLFFNMVLFIALFSFAKAPKAEPYLIKQDSLGNVMYAGKVGELVSITDIEQNAFIRNFVTNVRQVIFDPLAEKKSINVVYQSIAGNSIHTLNAYYKENSPFERAKNGTVQVVVNSVIKQSEKTFQVTWTEIHRDLTGDIVSETHWQGLVGLEHAPTNNIETLNVNPLSLFVTDFDWSELTV